MREEIVNDWDLLQIETLHATKAPYMQEIWPDDPEEGFEEIIESLYGKKD